MCTVSLPSQCTEDGNTPADHCPAGFSGRCTHPPANNGEVQSEAIYNATDTSGLVQAACESGGGTWESGS
jgi:hypothetical protein